MTIPIPDHTDQYFPGGPVEQVLFYLKLVAAQGGGSGSLTVRDVASSSVSISDLTAVDAAELLRDTTGLLAIYVNDGGMLKYIPFTAAPMQIRYFAAGYFKAKINHGFGGAR